MAFFCDEIKLDKELQPEIVAVIGKITESPFLMQKGKRGRRPINMCTALEKLEKDAVERRDRKLIMKSKNRLVFTGRFFNVYCALF